MKYSEIPLAQTVVLMCALQKIRHVVLSPGSRNAPLTLGFTSHPDITVYSIVDERCAGFVALGMAKSLQEPVAVVCTSGSALLNYYPAVAEAFYSDIPLVVISADRPSYKIDIGDGQTIRQQGVLERHVVFQANLKQDILHATDSVARFSLDLPKDIFLNTSTLQKAQAQIQQQNESLINQALLASIQQKGPIHINVPLEEPLYTTITKPTVFPCVPAVENPIPSISEQQMQQYATTWNNASKKMILVGELAPNTIEKQFLDELAEQDTVLVFTETTSNLHHKAFFPNIDKILAPVEKDKNALEKLQPQLLITIGNMVVSKKIKSFLRTYTPDCHWHIDTKKAYNTYFKDVVHIKSPLNSFFAAFLPLITPKTGTYKPYWLALKSAREKRHQQYLEKAPYTDLVAFDVLLHTISAKNILHLSNSSTVRYAQLFDLPTPFHVFCNRGTSGIDGSTSTAIGHAMVSKSAVTLITGDLSFFYDSNALWNSYIPKNFKIIVINNSGGGIFRILPAEKNSVTFSTYFETAHDLSAKHLCAMYGFGYHSAADKKAIEQSLPSFYATKDAPQLLEIFTPRTLNGDVLIDYFKYLSDDTE